MLQNKKPPHLFAESLASSSLFHYFCTPLRVAHFSIISLARGAKTSKMMNLDKDFMCNPDLGLLVLRLGIGVLMLFHGMHKALYG